MALHEIEMNYHIIRLQSLKNQYISVTCFKFINQIFLMHIKSDLNDAYNVLRKENKGIVKIEYNLKFA